MTLDDVKLAIEKWESEKNTALKQLTSGYGFVISKSDYDKWEKDLSSPQYYVYLGITPENQLVFFVCSKLIENITSITQVIVSNFYRSVSQLNRPPSSLGDLQEIEAMTRIIRWLLNSELWFRESVDKDYIVSYFIVPTKDLNSFFIEDHAHRVIAILAMNLIFGHKNFNRYIELLFVGEKKDEGGSTLFTPFKDVTKPKPPFPD